MSKIIKFGEKLELEPSDLTASAITRLRWGTLLAVPAMPLLLLQDIVGQIGHMFLFHSILSIFTLLSLAAFMYVIVHRVINVLSSAKGEWESQHKANAQNFTINLAIGLVFTAFCVFALWGVFRGGTRFTLTDFSTTTALLNVLAFLWLVPAIHIAWSLKPIEADE